MGGIINYIEEQRQVYLYDFLIYICGVDISPYVQNLTITYTDRNAPGSADIVITNPFNQWVMTPENLSQKPNFRLTDDRYTETPKYKIFQAKRFLSNQIVFTKKDPESNLAKQDAARLLNSASGEIEQDFLQRYSFGPGSPIFSRFDTVKIFIKNPSDHPDLDRWFPAFTGTLENKPLSTDYVNGMSTLSLQVYDVRAAMSGMRMAINPYTNSSWATAINTNPTARQQQVFFDSDDAGFFKDIFTTTGQLGTADKTVFDNIFQGHTFVDMVSVIITGKAHWVDGSGEKDFGGIYGGVGHFKPGKVFKYVNPEYVANEKTVEITEPGITTSLEAWDNLCLFGVDSDGNPRKDFLTYRECDEIGRTSFWRQSNSPLEGRMHFLIPAQGLAISDMVRTSVDGINNIMANPDWTNRFALVSQICQMVDYEWSVTGSGDIIFEFPMYDFFPSNYGSNQSIYSVD